MLLTRGRGRIKKKKDNKSLVSIEKLENIEIACFISNTRVIPDNIIIHILNMIFMIFKYDIYIQKTLNFDYVY